MFAADAEAERMLRALDAAMGEGITEDSVEGPVSNAEAEVHEPKNFVEGIDFVIRDGKRKDSGPSDERCAVNIETADNSNLVYTSYCLCRSSQSSQGAT